MSNTFTYTDENGQEHKVRLRKPKYNVEITLVNRRSGVSVTVDGHDNFIRSKGTAAQLQNFAADMMESAIHEPLAARFCKWAESILPD